MPAPPPQRHRCLVGARGAGEDLGSHGEREHRAAVQGPVRLREPGVSAVRAALRCPGFGRLLAALAVSGIGDWLYNVALLALVWDRTGSAGWLAVTTVARVAPIVVLGPLGGVLAQRCDRRAVMVASDLVRAAAMLTLALVALAGWPVWLAPLIAGLATAAGAPYPPCVAATTPRLVGDQHLAGANTARALVTPAGVVLGPVLGALLLAVSTPSAAIAVNAVTFLLSAVAVLSVRAPGAFAPSAVVAGERDSVLSELVAGGRALLRHRVARRAVGADTGCSLVYGAQTVLLLPVAHRLGLGDSGPGPAARRDRCRRRARLPVLRPAGRGPQRDVPAVGGARRRRPHPAVGRPGPAACPS